MSASRPPNATGHAGDLLLPYVEGRLRPDEATRVEEHLSACSQCSSEAEELRSLILALKANKDAFCPEPWELYEFVRYGADPDRRIARHVAMCTSCAELAGSFTLEHQPLAMPPGLLAQLKQRLPGRVPEKTSTAPGFADLLERFPRWLRVPALAAGAAAAVVLLVVLLYPREIPQSVVALSSVAWEQAPRPKQFQPSRPKVAIILAFKGLNTRAPQKEVDSLYESLAPDMSIQERVQILPPADLKEAIRNGIVNARDQDDLLTSLGTGLGVSQAVVVTIETGPQGVRVDSRLMDTSAATVIASRAMQRLSPWKFDQALRQSVFSLLTESEGRGDSGSK